MVVVFSRKAEHIIIAEIPDDFVVTACDMQLLIHIYKVTLYGEQF